MIDPVGALDPDAQPQREVVSMTEQQARALCARRQAEQPQFSWLVRQRGAEDWIVAKLPGTRHIDAATIRADRADPIETADDPRPANFRNILPFGGGY